MNGYVRILGIEMPTRYAVGIGATVVAVLVLLVGGRGGSSQDQAATTSTSTSASTTTTVPRTGRSPITIRQRTAADLVIRADWVKKGSSQYADPSDDRASTQTITTLAPSTSASVPRYRPATTSTDLPSDRGAGG
ncbi:MAG: hypothetical protein ACKO04_07830 [Actinomycetes bacterium]